MENLLKALRQAGWVVTKVFDYQECATGRSRVYWEFHKGPIPLRAWGDGLTDYEALCDCDRMAMRLEHEAAIAA